MELPDRLCNRYSGSMTSPLAQCVAVSDGDGVGGTGTTTTLKRISASQKDEPGARRHSRHGAPAQKGRHEDAAHRRE
jgi:hypothetical protein